MDFLIPVTVNSLPSIDTLEGRQGMFILPDGSINVNTKKGEWFTINKRSDHKGILKNNTLVSTVQGEGIWFWATEGVYPNAGNVSIAKFGIISYNGNTWASMEVELPESKAFIPAFANSTFPLLGSDSNPIQRTFENSIWQLIEGKTATATDLPSDDSTVWEKIGGEDFTEDKFNEEADKYNQGAELLSSNLSAVDFLNFVNAGDGESVFTYKSTKKEKALKLRVKIHDAGKGFFTCLRAGNLIPVASNIDLVVGWNDVDVDFEMLENDLIGYSAGQSTATIFYKDGTGGKYYLISGVEVNGNISLEVYGRINAFKKIISADLESLNVVKSVLKSFVEGSTVQSLTLSNTQLGFIRNDGKIQSGIDARYTEISVVGFDRIKYTAVRAMALDPTLYSSILVKKSDNTYVNLLSNVQTSEPQILTSQTFNLPSNSVSALIGWSNYEQFTNSTAKVDLIKNGTASEDSVLNLINSKETVKAVGNETLIFLEKPENFLPVVNLVGVLPTDISDARAKTDMALEMYNGAVLMFKCKVQVKIQGASSVNANKLNYNVKFINDVGETLKIKIGDWNVDSSYHFKGYGLSDASIVSRDISASTLLSQIFKSRPFPKSLVSDFPRYNSTNDANTSNYGEDANMTLRGFPIQLNRNGSFLGLYIFRQRRENGNFRMNDSLKNNIFLANSNDVEHSIHTGFNPQQWELKSPKVSGYQENGVINDTIVMGHINTFFDWCTGINDGTVNFEATANNVINIDNWVDVLIFNQVVNNWDYYMNNLNLFFWGTKWSLGVTDLDNTSGLGVTNYGGINSLNWRGTFFPNKIYPALLSRIKTRYTELRNSGIIDLNNLNNIYSEIPSKIGENNYKKQIDLWGVGAFPLSNTGLFNTERIMQIFIQRLVYLDSIWKL